LLHIFITVYAVGSDASCKLSLTIVLGPHLLLMHRVPWKLDRQAHSCCQHLALKV